MFKCIRCQAEINVDFKACPFCGEPVTDFVRRFSQESLDGKYRLVGRLGAGGMGEVFRAEHIHLHTTRVIKLMRPNLSAETNATDRFLREARMATRIHHPNVATLHDFSTLPDGSYYMVWEFIEGKNLTEVIRRDGAFSPRRAAILGVQILLGLDAIHRAGIIHRDVSPDNVMLSIDEDGTERAKIIDLGIAKQGGDEIASQTQTGIFIGKLKYCSPEHLGILPEGEKMDGRADLYSFGIVLYEMVAGATPFSDETPQQYILSHAKKAPRPLRQVNPKIDDAPQLEAVIFKALEKDRNQRFSTAREFAQALEAIIPGLSDTPLLSDKTLYVPIAGTLDTTQVTPSPDARNVPTTVEGTRPAANDATMYVGTAPPKAAVTDTRSVSRDTYVVPQGSSGAHLSRDTYVVPSTPVAPQTEPGSRRSGGLGLWIALFLFLFAIGAAGAFLFFRATSEPERVVDNTATTVTTTSPAPTPQPIPATTATTGTTATTTTDAPNSTLTVEGAPLATDTATTATTTATAAPTQTTSTVASRATTRPATRSSSRRAETTTASTTSAATAPTPVPEPVPVAQGYARGKGRAFVDSKDYSSGFSRGILPDYNALTQGEGVQWSWVAPGTKLSNHSIRVGRWRNLSGHQTPAIEEFLTSQLQSEIDDVVSGGSTLTTEGAVVWAANERGSKRGMAIEMVFRDGAGRVVAMMRHRIYENNPEDAAEEMPEAIVEFIESNK